MAKRSNEPAVWFLFGTGGFIVAYVLPILILMFGILFPLGLLPDPGYDATLGLVRSPLTRIILAVLCSFGFVHAAHRIRLTLSDFLLAPHLRAGLGVICYLAALAGIAFTVYLMVAL